MPPFSGTIRFQNIASAAGNPLLSDFTCGDDRHGYAVDELVHRQYTGEALQQPTILAMTDSSYDPVRTIGLCAWRHRALPDLRRRRNSDVYFHLLGLSHDYRGYWLPRDISLALPNETSIEFPSNVSLGYALMGAALQHISDDQTSKLWRRNPMPAAWGFVHPENENAHNMLASYGFNLYVATAGLVRFRPRQLPV
jgi:hypothetical protein